MKNDFKKSLYEAFQKALGSKQGVANSVKAIVEDIADPNMQAEVPQNKLIADKQGVLYKDASLAEMHQQKQMQAEAKLGMTPKMPAMKKIDPNEQNAQISEKGVGKLKKFMQKCVMKKSQKGVHNPDYSTTYIKNGKVQDGISTAGIKTREAHNPSSFEEYEESPKAAKKIHQQKLTELKEMPKPKLPK